MHRRMLKFEITFVREEIFVTVLPQSFSSATDVILLQGGKSATQYDSDTEIVFRQESFFNWTFGVCEC